MGEDMRLHSRCERCGRPMVKTWAKGWIVDKTDQAAKPAP